MNAISIAARIDSDTVTMQRSEFDRLIGLLEDAQDSAAAESISRRLASGEKEAVPSTFVDRVLDGEQLFRLWREHRGLSAADFADRTGIAPATLALIEAGSNDASVHDLKTIAEALGLSLDDLVR